MVSEYQANTCWPVELAGTTGSDLGEGHGCRSRPQEAAVAVPTLRGGAGILTAFPLRLVVVRNLKKQQISLTPTPLTYQSKQAEQSSSLILKALLGNNVGISFMEKY